MRSIPAGMAKRLRTGAGRHPLDAYQTPENVVEAMCRHIEHARDVLEPAAGDGRIVRVLRAHGHRVRQNDVAHPDGYDFLKRQRPVKADVVTNPPYLHGKLLAFVSTALELCDGRVTMLLPGSALWGNGKARRWLGAWGRPDVMVVISNRIYFHVQGSDDHIAGQFFSHAWVSWPVRADRPHGGGTMIYWERAGEKPR